MSTTFLTIVVVAMEGVISDSRLSFVYFGRHGVR